MSTRCNIIVTDENSTLIFYKHSDGYPEHTLPILAGLMDNVIAGVYRDNTSQFAGHLILSGHELMKIEHAALDAKYPNVKSAYAWKCGYIEPTSDLHGDIDFLYVMNLNEKKVYTYEANFDEIFKRVWIPIEGV